MTARRPIPSTRPTPKPTIAELMGAIGWALKQDPSQIEHARDLLTEAYDLAPGAPALADLAALLLPAPADYVEHVGDAAPVAADALVVVSLGDGVPRVDLAGAWCWGPGVGPDGEGRIRRWARAPATLRPAPSRPTVWPFPSRSPG